MRRKRVIGVHGGGVIGTYRKALASYPGPKRGPGTHRLRMCRKNNRHSPEFVYLLRITSGDLLAGKHSLASATPERDCRPMVQCFYLCSATNQ